MLPLLPWTIYILVRSLSGVDARAVNTTITSLPTFDISSTILADSVSDTASPQRCGDIDNCRTLGGIIQSCLVTILACVWFAVHRNIPAPQPIRSRHQNFFVRCVKWVWHTVLDQREAAMVFVVALIAPEWILAWALRQAMAAWKLAQKLEKVRLEEKERRKGVDIEKDEDGGEIATREDEHSSMDGPLATHTGSETGQLTKRRSSPSKIQSTCDKCEGHGPLYPLSAADVVELVRRGHLVPPTAAEISDKSKGDALSKGVAIVQTLWFVIQWIARRAERLPVTNLEVMTLAYTVITIAMYAAWWEKPLNVNCAIRMPEEEIEVKKADEYDSIWQRIMVYVVGAQDAFVDLRQRKRVPTFWAGNAGEYVWVGDTVALLVAMVFGAVHCIAWSSEFQSPLERQLWRLSAITIIASIPAVLVILLFVGRMAAECLDMDGNAISFLLGALYTPVSIIYIAARLILIFLSFTSLRGLPISAYQSVQWTTVLPHI
ncbi:hypothetical protein FIBSPDRAFT_739966 [Athelia psychrophila]|uniref:Uncharacterized protein n=1 Tax=Athelia psychrophila TaxID=1759441 RepID=A0A166KDN0_9AGAM|nr:hypothetical protein FIBSPDRAFT_739966 [Fibularhizoctonia sp. CBS 109695]